jgi:hypothetical protein
MKKVILSIITLLSLFAFSTSSFAATQPIESTHNIQSIQHQTISHVEYDTNSHFYYAITQNNNGEWVLPLMPSTDSTLTNKLTQSLNGSHVWLTFDSHNALNSDYWEVLNWDFEPSQPIQPNEHSKVVTDSIQSVQYDNGYYYMVTSDGWELDLFPSYDSSILDTLNKQLKGKNVSIVYDDNGGSKNYEDWSVITYEFEL